MRQTIYQQAVEGLGRLLFIIPPKPEIAQIEVTNRCNFNCFMCQRLFLGVPTEDMDFELYKKIINRLPSIRHVILTSWGEPLMHPEIDQMIKYARDRKKYVELTSNGSLLTFDWVVKLIKSGLNSISFSIDDLRKAKTQVVGHPVINQINNIETFLQYLKKQKKKLKVVIQVTLHKGRENKILEIIRWAAKIGTSGINVNRLDTRFNKKLTRPNYNEEKEFTKKLDAWGRQYKIQTEFRPHIAFSGIARLGYRILGHFLQRGGQHCLQIYNYIYINQAGEVTPCCALPLRSVGNLLKTDIEKIWKSEKFQKFRKHDFQRKICGGCDVLEVKQYAKEN